MIEVEVTCPHCETASTMEVFEDAISTTEKQMVEILTAIWDNRNNIIDFKQLDNLQKFTKI